MLIKYCLKEQKEKVKNTLCTKNDLHISRFTGIKIKGGNNASVRLLYILLLYGNTSDYSQKE